MLGGCRKKDRILYLALCHSEVMILMLPFVKKISEMLKYFNLLIICPLAYKIVLLK
jgi:hypothetical protein